MTQENINMIISGLLIPLLPVVSAFLIAFLKKKTVELESKINNDNISHYLTIAEDAVYTTVDAITQTMVESLKKNGNFDEAAQKEILEKAKVQAVNNMGQAALMILNDLYGDVDAWLENKIEAYIASKK